MTRYLYYPGCSMESSAKAYQQSLTAICDTLGLHLEEVEDWNCCGATEYVGISLTPAYALIARNLALAARQAEGLSTLVAPCSACYLNLAKCDHYMEESPRLNRNVNAALAAGGLQYKAGAVRIRHLLDVIINDIGLEAVRSRVVRPLTGLRLAPYLGCMVPRPDYEHRWENHEHPTELDRLLRVLGAEVVDFPLKTHCCGGHMTQIGPDTAFELIRRLVHAADQYHTDLMVTLCPMCQLNVDAYQGEMNRFCHTDYQVPIVFFTQVLGLAFGLEPKSLGFGSEMVSARHALLKVGASPPEPAEPAGPGAGRKHRPKLEGLPMPQMPGGQEVGS